MTFSSLSRIQAKDAPIIFAIILISAVLMFFPALGSFGIMDPSDGLYAEAAREMVESGNYLTPYFNYVPFLEKPILVYWLIAVSFKLFGVSEFAARLPAALAAVETVLFVFFAMRDYVSTRAAFLSCLVIMSNLLFAVIGHLALTDMELSCLATVAALSIFKFIDSPLKQPWRFYILACACLTLTCLLKGPVIVIISGLALTAYRALLNVLSPVQEKVSFWQFVRRTYFGAALVIVFSLSLPWYLTENWLTQGRFFQEFFIHQNLGRISGAINHIEPPWFYLPYLFIAFLPWSLLIPFTVSYFLRRFRRRRPLSKSFRLVIFCFSWAAVCFLFFSSIKTKLPTYILPGIPLMGVFTGVLLDVYARMRSKWCLRYAVGFMSYFALFSIGEIVALVLSSPKLGAPSSFALSGFIAAALASLAGSVALFLRRETNRFPCTAAAIFWLITVVFLTPSSLLFYYQIKHADFRDIVLGCSKVNLATFWRDTTAGVFYHRGKVTLVNTIEDLERFRRTSDRPHWIIVTSDLIPFLKLEAKNANLHCLKAKGRFALFDLDASE